MTSWTSICPVILTMYIRDKSEVGGGWCSAFITSQGTPGEYMFYNTEDGDDPNKYDINFDKSDNNLVFGDFDSDGLIDFMHISWGGSWTPVEGLVNEDGSRKTAEDNMGINWNMVERKPEAPLAPESVTAMEVEGADGEITVEWDPSSLATGMYPMYNLYIKNMETGKTFMLIPANMETGCAARLPAVRWLCNRWRLSFIHLRTHA